MKTCTDTKHYWNRDGRCRCGALHRCIISFANGTRCRRRAADGTVCAKHAPAWKRIVDFNRDVADGLGGK